MNWTQHRIDGLDGFRIIETRALPEEVSYCFLEAQLIFTGRVSAFRYEVARAQIRIDMRADLERQLDAFAKRVGVDRLTMSE